MSVKKTDISLTHQSGNTMDKIQIEGIKEALLEGLMAKGEHEKQLCLEEALVALLGEDDAQLLKIAFDEEGAGWDSVILEP